MDAKALRKKLGDKKYKEYVKVARRLKAQSPYERYHLLRLRFPELKPPLPAKLINGKASGK